MKILVTGTAGFIGFHVAKQLLEKGEEVIGVDQINEYYDINLKYSRLRETGINPDNIPWNHPVQSTSYTNYRFYRMNLENRDVVMQLFEQEKPGRVIHLAAQAGVRYSLTHPDIYLDSNIHGFLSILEACRHYPVDHLVYASSSSVYGLNKSMPFSEHQPVDHPVSLYAATKKSNEMMAHTYSYLFDIPTTGLRFFTVYGPWGRPDMALFLFTKNILAEKPIDVYNYGNMERDFTYVDDIVNGVIAVSTLPPEPSEHWNAQNTDPSTSSAPYRILNIGNSKPVKLMDFIKALEQTLGKEAILNKMPIQPGDVPATWADTSALKHLTGYQPETPVEEGIQRFVTWYRRYYNK
ncbi:MAG TPA: NAD-dependent epimerase [Bacteroidetes bacterium]|nr:NAD-dependent epimerase [Bacteroidota bacterium]